jgi:hypothetical protein
LVISNQKKSFATPLHQQNTKKQKNALLSAFGSLAIENNKGIQ